MDNACGQDRVFKNRQCGASRLKFLLIVAIIGVVAYVGYQYIPVAYNASRFKLAMQDSVDKAAALGHNNEKLRTQLRADGNQFSVPPDAEITIERTPEGRVQARVKYVQPVPLPGYVYSYDFDHTVKSTELFSSK